MLIQLPQGYEPCALPMRHAGEKCLFFLSKYAQPPDKLGDVTSLALTTRFCKPGELKEYRRLGSNQRPRGYEPRALPLRHSGNMVWLYLTSLARRVCLLLIKQAKCNNTGDPFRSGVLKVMSLARFLCATPVTGCLAVFLSKYAQTPR